MLLDSKNYKYNVIIQCDVTIGWLTLYSDETSDVLESLLTSSVLATAEQDVQNYLENSEFWLPSRTGANDLLVSFVKFSDVRVENVGSSTRGWQQRLQTRLTATLSDWPSALAITAS